MILILLSWIYILFTSLNFGFICDRILHLKNKNFVVTVFLGLFSITILASIWAIFGRINIEFHLFLLVCNLFIFFKFKKDVIGLYQNFIAKIRRLSLSLKIYLLLTTILILAQCSTLPYIIDNESYYIQTIKWFNEYGFVKGIANLHLYLGQASGWHITQSVFNFSFLYSNFNDLSGFCLLLGMLFSIEKLNQYFQNNNLSYLIIALFPLANLYFFQFIAAPSPDIAIYVLTFIVLFYFVENFKNCSAEVFNLIVILVLYMLYIKSTAIVFALIPIILLLNNFRLFKKLVLPSVVAILILSLFIIKNMIVSGSILFPSKAIAFITADYSIPKTIEIDYYHLIEYFGYRVNAAEFQKMSFYELFWNWFSMPKLNGIFNKLCVLMALITPIFIYKFQNKREYWILYGLMILQISLLFATSPQFRFFTNFLLFFGLFCFVCLIRTKSVIIPMLYLSILPVVFLLFIPIQLQNFTNNPFMASTSNFTAKAIFHPLENSKLKTEFELIEIGNFKYNSPIQNDFFYGTGNGDLPCVNKAQVEYYRKNFNYIPQMRTNDLKDGFYSKKVNDDE